MNVDNLSPITRMIVREVAYGLDDHDICVNHPEFQPSQIAKMRCGATFKRALAEMQKLIDQETIEKMAEDPVRAYLQGKGMSAAKTLARLAANEDCETPHAVQSKAADSILAKAGYAAQQDNIAVPVLMLSPEKLESIMNPKSIALDMVPDQVDGHNGGLEGLEGTSQDSLEDEDEDRTSSEDQDDSQDQD